LKNKVLEIEGKRGNVKS